MMEDNDIPHDAGVPFFLDHADDIHGAVDKGVRLPDATLSQDGADPFRRFFIYSITHSFRFAKELAINKFYEQFPGAKGFQ